MPNHWQWHTWYRTFALKGQCPALGCPWRYGQTECPNHGIGAYYERCAREGRDSGD